MYEKAKMYYENGVWSEAVLRLLVQKGKLTRAEYKAITGNGY